MRGRAYGQSRVVCGVHTPSAVEAGRTVGGSVLAVLNTDPTFRADLEAARAELAQTRRTAAAPQACDALNALAAATPY